jgi:hypothetical protein
MLGWPRLFGTSDPKEVEAICRKEGAPEVQWIGPNKDTFLQEWIDEPFQRHPITNEEVWFNHSNVFHWTTFPAELWFAFCRIRDIQLLIQLFCLSRVARSAVLLRVVLALCTTMYCVVR